jgi:hypothetical protein
VRVNSADAAWQEETVRETWRRYRRHAWFFTAVGLALFIVSTTLIGIIDRPLEELEATGDQVPGVVIERRIGLRNAGSVEVEFSYKGAARRGTVQLNDASPGYDAGDDVTVLVDPEDQRNFTIEGEKNEPKPFVYLIIVVLLGSGFFLVTGVVSIWRSGRQRRRLRRSPWQRVAARSQIRAAAGWRRLLLNLELSDGRTEVVGLVYSLRWAQEETASAGELDVVGGELGYWVVRQSGHTRLISARRPCTSWVRRRWSRPFR